MSIQSVAKQSLTWENQLAVIPGIRRITEGDYSTLRHLLASCENEDSYLTSPIYYAFTGRLGLWVYEKNGAFVLLCWHPNVSGQVLIFPQLANRQVDLVSELLEIIPIPENGIKIARAKPLSYLNYLGQCNNQRGLRLNECVEQVLDWQFPVRILSTTEVAAITGGKFMYIRNRLRQLKNCELKVVPFDRSLYRDSLENLLDRWVTHNARSSEEYELLYAPYHSLFSWSLNESSGLAGIMIFVDGTMQAVGLWDVSNLHSKTANLYVDFCNVRITGLSEFLMVESCRTLRDRGVNLVNLGGSESKSLDFFKNKFRPVMSIDLCSIEVQKSKTFSKLECDAYA